MEIDRNTDTIKIDRNELDDFFLHINAEPRTFDDRKYEKLWCNKKRKGNKPKPLKVSGMEAKHFKATKISFSRKRLSMDESSAMEEDYYRLVKTNIRPEPYDLLRKLFDEKNYEATTRVFIDALVTRITQYNMLHFSPETCYKLQEQTKDATKESGAYQRDATKKPDYIIKNTNGPIGVVEAKRGKALTRRSITQCMEQLLAIQLEIKDNGHNIPLFGIVTDALHFIFIKLHPNGQFEFEQDDIDEVKVHRANTWGDFHEITEIFNGLCKLHKKFVSSDSLI